MFNVFNSIRTLRRLTQREEGFFQSLTDRAVRFTKNEDLVLVEKIFAKAVKQMQKMPQEPNAVENCDFDTTRFVILGAGVFANLIGHGFGRTGITRARSCRFHSSPNDQWTPSAPDPCAPAGRGRKTAGRVPMAVNQD